MANTLKHAVNHRTVKICKSGKSGFSMLHSCSRQYNQLFLATAGVLDIISARQH